jgi:DNA-binding NarL/FixJ family response regulator
MWTFRWHLYSAAVQKTINLMQWAALSHRRFGIEASVVRILVVDDNAMIRSHLREMLEQKPEWVVVGEACNGRDALEACDRQKPDLTVMDFSMPEMDGLEAARRLTKQSPKVPILMVTVDPSRQLEAEARKAGIKGLCAKAHIATLLNAAEALLKGFTYFPLGLAPAA